MRRGGWIVHAESAFFDESPPTEIAAVPARSGDHDTGVIERFAVKRRFAPAPRIGDLARACAPFATRARSSVLGRFQARTFAAIRLHQHDMAALADRVGHLDVNRHLQRPTIGFCDLLARHFAFAFGGVRVFAQRFGVSSFCDAARKRQIPFATVLIDLFEAAVGPSARGQGNSSS